MSFKDEKQSCFSISFSFGPASLKFIPFGYRSNHWQPVGYCGTADGAFGAKKLIFSFGAYKYFANS